MTDWIERDREAVKHVGRQPSFQSAVVRNLLIEIRVPRGCWGKQSDRCPCPCANETAPDDSRAIRPVCMNSRGRNVLDHQRVGPLMVSSFPSKAESRKIGRIRRDRDSLLMDKVAEGNHPVQGLEKRHKRDGGRGIYASDGSHKTRVRLVEAAREVLQTDRCRRHVCTRTAPGKGLIWLCG